MSGTVDMQHIGGGQSTGGVECEAASVVAQSLDGKAGDAL